MSEAKTPTWEEIRDEAMRALSLRLSEPAKEYTMKSWSGFFRSSGSEQTVVRMSPSEYLRVAVGAQNMVDAENAKKSELMRNLTRVKGA